MQNEIVSAQAWREVEITLTAAQEYANGYTDVEVWAEFSHESGATLRRPAFWDGGHTWKIRFASPLQEGRWTWRTVSTPQDVAFLDAKKAIGLFKTVETPILGVIENMSSFLCPHCKGETHIFGHGGVKTAAYHMGLPFLGEIPIDLEIRAGSDQGTPLVVGHPDSPQSKVFMEMAASLKTRLML